MKKSCGCNRSRLFISRIEKPKVFFLRGRGNLFICFNINLARELLILTFTFGIVVLFEIKSLKKWRYFDMMFVCDVYTLCLSK